MVDRADRSPPEEESVRGERVYVEHLGSEFVIGSESGPLGLSLSLSERVRVECKDGEGWR